MDEANCRLGKKRHKPVSSIHTRASSSVSVPCPLKRILSAREASNCSAVKEKPHFQAGDQAFFRHTTRSPEFLYGLGFQKVTSSGLCGLYPGWFKKTLRAGLPCAPESGGSHLPNHSKCELDSMEGPQNLLPGIKQSDWTSVRATRWMLSLCKLQQ